MDWALSIAEEKIQEATRRGELDDLPGKGKPLKLDDDSMIPAELRASYRLLKNSGILPEEVQLHKDMVTLQELLDCCQDNAERKRLHSDLSMKKLRFQTLMSERGWQGSAAFQQYAHKIEDKLKKE